MLVVVLDVVDGEPFMWRLFLSAGAGRLHGLVATPPRPSNGRGRKPSQPDPTITGNLLASARNTVGGVEAGNAEPVDRAVPPHQGRGRAVAEQAVGPRWVGSRPGAPPASDPSLPLLPTRTVGLVGRILFLALAAWNLRTSDTEHGADVEVSHGRVVLSVATAMFVAELGDKTMLATATLAAQGDPALVWIGATLGIIASGALGGAIGRTIGARIPRHIARLGSSILFAAFGTVLIATNL